MYFRKECGTGGTATLSGYPGTRTQDTPWEGLGCKTFTGSIALATDVAWGAFGIYDIEEITGSFVAHDSPQLKDVSFRNLRKLETLSLKNPDIGAFLDVRRLEELENLEWSQLWYSGGMGWRINITRISSFVIEETFITTLTADQDWDASYSSFRSLKTADDIRIETNPQMGTISLPELTSVTNSLIIGYNSVLDHTYFPALEWAGSITLRGNGLNIHPASAARLDLPILTEVKGLFNVSDNPRMEEISLPALQKVDGAVLLEENPTLRTLFFPSLETISGDVLIRGNNLSSSYFKHYHPNFFKHSIHYGFKFYSGTTNWGR
ncbi:Fungal trichothecene efflux pump [Lasiodiplodia theobromae]|nr:Fungal trichothecene efflux pump [Lasiodiplodia theobromae]